MSSASQASPALLPPAPRLWIGITGCAFVATYVVLLILALLDDRAYMLSLWLINAIIVGILVVSNWIGWRSGRPIVVGAITAAALFVLAWGLGLSGHTPAQSLQMNLQASALAQSVGFPMLSAVLMRSYIRAFGPEPGSARQAVPG